MSESISLITSRVCRVCLAPNGEFSDIFPFSTAIMECAPVNITVGDGLPSLICETCLNRLQAAQQFRVLCVQSDIELRRNGGEIATSYPVKPSPPVLDNFTEFEGDNLDQFISETPEPSPKKPTAPQSFICKACYNPYPTLSELTNHKCQNTNEKQHICKYCTKHFNRAIDLKKHIRRIHTGNRPHKCSVCSKPFLKLCQMKVHMRKHTGEKPFECDVCHKKFIHKFSLKTHMSSHTGLYPYVCDVCSKGFNHTYALSLHMRIHTGERPYCCDICSKRFSTFQNLRIHKRVHSGDKPFKCNICDRSFTQKPNLSTHLRVHSGERPFNCKICGKDFTSNAVLRQHMRTHTGEKPFSCEECMKEFNDRGSLRKHIQSHNRYTCEHCGKKFTNQCSCTKTVKKEVRKRSTGTVTKIEIVENVAVRGFACEICFLKFNNGDDFEKHKLSHQSYYLLC